LSGSGSPLCTLDGTRQHARCTYRAYDPLTKSRLPTLTSPLGMKHGHFLRSSTVDWSYVLALVHSGHFVVPTRFRCSHPLLPVFASSTV